MSFFSTKKTHSTISCHHSTSSLKETPPALIDHTFAEARCLHDEPLAAKMALRMNEHNNGHIAMGKYVVWTSEVNDKPDLNEAFSSSVNTAQDPLVRLVLHAVNTQRV